LPNKLTSKDILFMVNNKIEISLGHLYEQLFENNKEE
jgi:hypothetical protein